MLLGVLDQRQLTPRYAHATLTSHSTMWDATIEEQLAWMDQMTSKETAEAMPHYVGTSWFNVGLTGAALRVVHY